MANIELRFRTVDVFSDRPLAGNALCVVLDPAPEPVMQAIAREANLSETTFVNRTSDSSYDVRIFTPATELPFAGHPTLGSAWVLGPGRWTQHSPGTTVEVDVDETSATMGQPDPELTEVDPELAAQALGIAATEAPAAYVIEVGGLRHCLVVTEQPLARLRPNQEAVEHTARTLRVTGVAAVRPQAHDAVQVRLFGAGFGEDPGTGSAAGAAALICRDRYGLDTDVTIHQGDEMGRPCRIAVHAERGAVRVGGAVANFATGLLTL